MLFLNKEIRMHKIYLIFFLVLSTFAKAQSEQVRASLSKNIILVGDTFTYTVEAVTPLDCEGFWPKLSNYIRPPFYIIKEDSVIKKYDRKYISNLQSIQLSCYDSGVHQLPPIPFINICDSNTKLFSDSLSIMVNNVKVDMSADIKEEEEEVKTGISPAQKNALIIFGIVALVAILYILYQKYWKKNKLISKPVINPFDAAMQVLKNLKIAETSDDAFKKYYSALTQCLKEYLQHQLKIPVLGLTSTEAKAVLQNNADTKLHTSSILEIFNRADFAKFAKLPPTIDFAQQDLQLAKDIIMDLEQKHTMQLHIQKEKELANKKKL
jgi:hypothetical protein